MNAWFRVLTFHALLVPIKVCLWPRPDLVSCESTSNIVNVTCLFFDTWWIFYLCFGFELKTDGEQRFSMPTSRKGPGFTCRPNEVYFKRVCTLMPGHGAWSRIHVSIDFWERKIKHAPSGQALLSRSRLCRESMCTFLIGAQVPYTSVIYPLLQLNPRMGMNVTSCWTENH